MTQNDVNNPYGAYLEAKIELDSRVARAVGIQDKQLSWNAGFLSWSDCVEYETNEQGQQAECMKRGSVVTPGKLIETQLSNTFGTGVRQLELADELDELVSALFTQLLKKAVFGVQGLFRGGGADGGSTGLPPLPPPTTRLLNVFKSGDGL